MDSVDAKLEELEKRLVPEISEEDVAMLETVLREAQSEKPHDAGKFAERVNRLLDIYSLRIQTEDGNLGRLRRNEGGLGITRSTGGGRGFKNATIRLVGVTNSRGPGRGMQPTEPSRSR